MHQVTIDPKYQVKLTWMVDWPERNVFFHVKNGLNKKYRWFALGFSRRGEFPKTDFCFFQRSTNNDKINIHIVSYYHI
jgi:dopamine beta-monooxygenase